MLPLLGLLDGAGCFGRMTKGATVSYVFSSLTEARIVAMVVGGSVALLFFFVPETFWDRTPRPKSKSKRPGFYRSVSELAHSGFRGRHPGHSTDRKEPDSDGIHPTSKKRRGDMHVGFAEDPSNEKTSEEDDPSGQATEAVDEANALPDATHSSPTTPAVARRPLENSTDPVNNDAQSSDAIDVEALRTVTLSPVRNESEEHVPMDSTALYTYNLRAQPRVPYWQTLRPWNGRLSRDKWYRIAIRPFILFAYPAVLWSAAIYSLSIGWLIVLSESVATIYENKATYNFSALGTGLVYISPFVGGILGTAVAGRVSDVVVRFMTRRNGGIYEPEFRLVMAIPITISTVAGLMGFGWSVQEKDAWIVPTIFFGLISFGCSLGSTTSITFCVDSYRQYAGEALVTLNFSKSMYSPFSFRVPFDPLMVIVTLNTDKYRYLPWIGILPLHRGLAQR